ncbi:MAG: GNAT family N-acetyltransferase [Phycicoccus sp.]
MTTTLETPEVGRLGEVVRVLREWQRDGSPVRLHPGDLGWHWRLGAEATAAAVRTWSADGRIVVVGLLDGAGLLRVALAPDAEDDAVLARRLVADVESPERGVLPTGEVAVELPVGALAHDLLGEAGWVLDEPWAILHRGLAEAVDDPAVRVDTVGSNQARRWAETHRAAFDAGTSLTDDAVHRRWLAMADGLPYADARSLAAYDDLGRVAAVATVWSAGRGRYGVVEPLGVHPDHRGHGYGRVIATAAAHALREMGSSGAVVCTPASNAGAVATYLAAGFEQIAERRDRRRDSVTLA